MSSADLPSHFRLDGRTALITGGGRGLGAEIAWAYAFAGANVVLVSRNGDKCQAVADEIQAATGVRATGWSLHMGDWDAQEVTMDRVYDEFGQLDILVNNAGSSPLYENLSSVSEQLFDKVFAVNIKGPFRLTALAASRMVQAGRGSIINISSISAERPGVTEIPYAAAKAGLNSLTKGFARAYGPTVRVNAILAGPFLTDISQHWDMDAVRENLKAYPLQRAGEPHEIAGAALYLASDASSYTTGALLPIDGGRLTR